MEFNAEKFIRAIYLAASPSIDIDKAEQIVPWEHTLTVSRYEELLKESAGDDRNIRLYCNMFMLDKGPKLID